MIFLWDNVLYLVPCTLIIQRYANDFSLLKHTLIRVYSKIVFNHVFREIAKLFCYHFWYWHILQTWCWPFICLYLIEYTRLNCVLVNEIIAISYGLCVWAGRNLLPWMPCISLTHWGRVTHICVNKLTIIGSDNGLPPGRRQAIIWTNSEILLIRTLGTNFSETIGKIYSFPFKKCIWKCRLRKGVYLVSASV